MSSSTDGGFEGWSRLHGGIPPSAPVRAWLRLVQRLAAGPFSRVPPDVLSAAGVLSTLLAALVAAAGGRWAALTAALVLLAGLFDGLDGAVALHTGRVRPLGAVIDAMADRVGDLLLVATLAVLGAPPAWCVAVAGLVFGHEYLRARAQGAGLRGVGAVTVAERPTRVIVVAVIALGAAVLPGGTPLTGWSWAAVGAGGWLVVGVIGLAQLAIAVVRELPAQAGPTSAGDDRRREGDQGQPAAGVRGAADQVETGHRGPVGRAQQRGARPVRGRAVDRPAGCAGLAAPDRPGVSDLADRIRSRTSAPRRGEDGQHAVGVALAQPGRVPVDAARRVVARRVDQHEPALAIGRRGAARGRRGRARRRSGRRPAPAGGRRWRRTRRRSRRGKQHPVRGARCAAVEAEQQHEPRQRPGAATQPPPRAPRPPARQQPLVEHRGVGVADHDVGRHRGPVGQLHAGTRPAAVHTRATSEPVRSRPRGPGSAAAARPPMRRRPPRTYQAPKSCSTYDVTASTAGVRRGSEPE